MRVDQSVTFVKISTRENFQIYSHKKFTLTNIRIYSYNKFDTNECRNEYSY